MAWIDHVNLTYPEAADAAMKRFWLEIIGLPRVEKPPGSSPSRGFWAGTPPGILHFTPRDDHVAAVYAHTALRVADLDALARRVKDEDGEVDWNWDAIIPGITRFITRDPGGNIVELIADDTKQSA